MKFLKNHPFAMQAFFESSVVLTFAIHREQLENLIPECLELDTFQEKWAFMAIAMVQTRGLRPKGFPMFMGNDFFLIGYRVFVRYENMQGKRLRGLYILKSETDSRKMEFFGNLFTHYCYTTTDIKLTTEGHLREIKSNNSKFSLIIDQSEIAVQIPDNSPFTDWKNARRFAGPLPFTFYYQKEDKTVLIIKGVRQNWQPEPLKVRSYSFEFLNNTNFENAVLANAFEIKNIPYYWEKGKIEKWSQ